MNMFPVTFSSGTRYSLLKNFLRLALSLSLLLLAATHAAAQYGGGGGGTGSGPGTPGYVAPKSYGSGKAIGIGVGAGAGAGVLFLALHHHGTMTGCVQPADDGLRLVNEKNNKSYALVSAGAVYLKPGQRVQLKGKKSKSESGAQTFAATKLVKDLGACSTSTPVAQSQPAAR